jgi:hypothetical protein
MTPDAARFLLDSHQASSFASRMPGIRSGRRTRQEIL